jgi:hypothetical protein
MRARLAGDPVFVSPEAIGREIAYPLCRPAAAPTALRQSTRSHSSGSNNAVRPNDWRSATRGSSFLLAFPESMLALMKLTVERLLKQNTTVAGDRGRNSV